MKSRSAQIRSWLRLVWVSAFLCGCYTQIKPPKVASEPPEFEAPPLEDLVQERDRDREGWTLALAEFQVDLTRQLVSMKSLQRIRSSLEAAERLPSPPPVTELLRLQTGNFRFDAQNKVFSFDVTLTNISQSSIFIPVKAIIETLRPAPPTVTILNADGGGNASGAFWEYSDYLNTPVELASGQTSAARNWQFSTPQMRLFSFKVRVQGELNAPQLPPDPAKVAPPLDRTVATDLMTASEFLYTGDNSIQTGVAPGTMEARRVAVLRGKVTKQDSTPLPGVTITIADHPEFGSTRTRADGMFDIAVNGGGLLTVNYEKAGYLSAQRQVEAPWQDYKFLPEVALIPRDEKVTTIDLNANNPMQIAQSSMSSDADGARRATLLFPQGTQAEMVMPDGSTRPISTLHVRATEYTVGSNGPNTMPAELPANSAYTYCMVLTADEGVAAGAKDIRFNQPLPFYVENFLDFPIGEGVPLGSYDADRGVWIPSDNGRVIKILDISNGVANLDTDGDNVADNGIAIGITEAERQRLASLYTSGQSLWRMLIPHFDDPWDANWGTSPDSNAVFPDSLASKEKLMDDPCRRGASIIECQNQILGEAVGIVGTPFTLHYQSDRVPGRKTVNTINIPVSGDTLPPSLKRIDLEVRVAGRSFPQRFPPLPNQRTTFTWDGKDAYGRTLQGSQPVIVRVGYVYNMVYQQTDRFGYNGNGRITGNRGRQEITLWTEWRDVVGQWDSRALGLGGWSLSMHHAYDPIARVLYLGDGTRRSARALGNVLTTVAGNGNCCFGGDGGPATQASISQNTWITVGPDGSLYIADRDNNRIRRVGPDGIINTIVGTGMEGFAGDGGPAIQAQLSIPDGVALGSDGSLYITDAGNSRIRRVTPDGIITTVAGTGESGYSGDGGPATQARLNQPRGIAVAADGSLYIADLYNNRIRRVGVDGIITTVAGTGNYAYNGDGIRAVQADLAAPEDVAMAPDGSIYIADSGNRRVRRVGPNGMITTIAGNGLPGGYEGEGGLATEAKISSPVAVAVGADGSFYIAIHPRILRVTPDGIITTAAGGGTHRHGNGDPATYAQLEGARDVALGPDGKIFVAEPAWRIRQVAPPVPGFGGIDLAVPSEDGSLLYQFDAHGRHLRTMNTFTGAMAYAFSYDAQGRLIQIEDGDGDRTTIERDGSGNPTAIVGPFGQRTALSLDANGYLASITNPGGTAIQLGYGNEGLLISLTDPKGGEYRFSYDDLGRLLRDEDPASGFTALERTNITANNYKVTQTTAMGRVSTCTVENLSTGEAIRGKIDPAGIRAETRIGKDGSRTASYPDGTIVTQVEGPDPRWGMQTPLRTNLTITTTGGLTFAQTGMRTISLTDPNNLLSLTTLIDKVSINGRNYTSTFDAATRTITGRTPAGRETVTRVDVQGRPLEVQIPGLAPISYAYDSRGRLTTVTHGSDSTARVGTISYDARGRIASLTDPFTRHIRFEYDSTNQVTKQTLPDGREIRYSYDANGNVITLTPPSRPAHSFQYTPIDLERKYIPPIVTADSTNTIYTYDADGQLTRVSQPDGTMIDYEYDGGGRPSVVRLPIGEVRYAYHPTTGNVTTITAPDGGTITFTYNGSLPVASDWAGTINGNVDYAYDNNFRITSESVNSSDTIDFEYDLDGLLTRAGALSISYNALNGLLTGTSVGNVTDAYSYNGFAELGRYSAAFNTTLLFPVEYVLDKLSRVTQLTETIAGTTTTYSYTYDFAGRLTDVSKNNAPFAHYSYDDNGNRLSYTDSSGAVISGTYDAQDRLVQYGKTTYVYTPNGELLTKTTTNGQTTYGYDGFGNLKTALLPNGAAIEYILDASGQRIGKKVNGNLVQGFLYGGSINPIVELDGGNDVVSRFVYGTGSVPDYMVKGGNTYRIISDHLGSPRIVINVVTGEITQRMDYDEFGNVTSDTNPGFQPFGFAGGIYDQHTKLIHFGAREYDSEIGRWTSKDPIDFAGGDVNLYAYVGNDPVNFVDPVGLDSEELSWWDRVMSSDLANAIFQNKIVRGFSNLVAGVGDAISFGGSRKVRQWLGFDDVVNPCSGTYVVGQWLGYAWWAAVPIPGAVHARLVAAGSRLKNFLNPSLRLPFGVKIKNILRLAKGGRYDLFYLSKGGKEILRAEFHAISKNLPSWLRLPHIHPSWLTGARGHMHFPWEIMPQGLNRLLSAIKKW